MWKVLLQPCGDSDANKHFLDTIEHPVPIPIIMSALEEADRTALAPVFAGRTTIPVWGVTPGVGEVNVRKWDRVEVGDCALFSRAGKVFASASVAAKVRSVALAERLWKRNADGETWECVYFLDELKHLDISYAAFNKAVGYKPNFVIQGFNVLSSERSASLDAAFELHSERYASNPPESEVRTDVATRFGDVQTLDSPHLAASRLEQAFLRRTLFGTSPRAICCVCGGTFPTELMAVAHIKKRSHCTLEEQLDFENVVAPMCVLGCDALFERGYLLVGDDGLIHRGKVDIASEHLEVALNRILRRRCTSWSRETEPYFGWHRNFHVAPPVLEQPAAAEPELQGLSSLEAHR